MQACDFGRLIDAVEASQRLHGVPEKEWGRTFVWIDVFSFRQNAVETDLAFLGQLLAWLGRVVMVLGAGMGSACGRAQGGRARAPLSTRGREC